MLRRGALIAVPVALCLAVEFGFDAPTRGAVASGAFICGFTAFGAPAAQRMRWQTVTALLIGLAAAAGILTSSSPFVAVAAMAIVGAAGGYCIAVSPWVSSIGLGVSLTLVVAQGLSLPIGDAGEALLWSAVGGLVQALWSSFVWAFSDRNPADRENGWSGAGARESIIENLDFSSPPARHALRLGAALAVGVATYLALGFDDHGFWIPLTIVFAMKPGRDETYPRLIMRGIGTLVGLVIASILAHTIGGSDLVVGFVLVISAALSYGLLSVQYALFTAAITIYIVLLDVSLGEPSLEADAQRLLGTAIGILIAFIAFIGLPDRSGSAGPARAD